MKLAIIRHGEAGYATTDRSRELTDFGQQQAQQLAAWVAQCAWNDEQPLLWSSPYVRAQQTSQAIAQALALPIVTQEQVHPDANPREILDLLTLEQQDIIFVAHQPLVGYLASLLTRGSMQPQPWQTAECWLLEGDVMAAGCMSLITQFRTSF